jgi:hypothetical protein
MASAINTIPLPSSGWDANTLRIHCCMAGSAAMIPAIVMAAAMTAWVDQFRLFAKAMNQVQSLFIVLLFKNLPHPAQGPAQGVALVCRVVAALQEVGRDVVVWFP